MIRRPSARWLLRDAAVNAGVPTLVFLVARHAGVAEVRALVWAAAVPAAVGLAGWLRRRSVDPIAAIALFAIAVSLLAAWLGGDARLLLIRESFVTATLGLACLLSLLLPRPLMFYFGRWFATRGEPAAAAAYEARWANPRFRAVNRTITLVWAGAFLGEFCLRVLLVVTLPPALVLALAPLALAAVTFATIAWTYRYVNRAGGRPAHA